MWFRFKHMTEAMVLLKKSYPLAKGCVFGVRNLVQ